MWHIISHDLLHDHSLGGLLLGLVSTHEVLEEREGTGGVSGFDVSVEVSGDLGQHLEVAESDHVLLEEVEVESEGDVDDEHDWAEVAVFFLASVMLSLVVVLATTVVFTVVLFIFRLLIFVGFIPKFITEHSVGLSSAIPLWFLGLWWCELFSILNPIHWWHWWGKFWSFIHHFVHETIKVVEVWILEIKMEFLTINIGVENEVGVRLALWEWGLTWTHWWERWVALMS